VIATSSIIPIDGNTNIKVENGKVVNKGNGYVIVGLSSPGLYESLALEPLKNLDKVIISYDTKKFELSSIYSIATPKLLENSDLSVLDKLNGLESDMNVLDSSLKQLEEGAKTILDGLTVVNDGSSQLSEKLKEVLTATEQLQSGAISLDDGIKKLVEQFGMVYQQMMSDEFLGQINELPQLIATNQSTILMIRENLSSLEEVYQANQLDKIDDTVLLNTNLNLWKVKYEYEKNYEKNLKLLTLLQMNQETIVSASNKMQVMIEKLPMLNQALEQLKMGSSSLSSGMNQLNMGVSVLSEKMDELASGVAQLVGGMASLNEGILAYDKDGISKLTSMGYSLSHLKNKVSSIVQLGNDYQSLGGKNSNIQGDIKFIFAVDGVKLKEEKKVVEKTTKKVTLIDRVRNLFK